MARVQMKVWVSVKESGCYVGLHWSDKVVVAPMLADGSRSRDKQEWVEITKESHPDLYVVVVPHSL